MKKYIFSIFMIMFIMLFGLNSHSQYIIAGQHDSGCYFYDIDPDSTIVGPNNHPPVNLPPAVYWVDINGDSFNDVFFYSRGEWVNGTGWGESKLRINDTTQCQIAMGYVDSCFENDGVTLVLTRNMINFLKENDTIDRRLKWISTPLYLYYNHFLVYNHSCWDNGFFSDTSRHYLAVRLFMSANDTVYGWIKVTNVVALSATIQEFACQTSSVNKIEVPPVFSRIFPNPTDNVMLIETQEPALEITVYDIYGMEKIKKSGKCRRTMIDLSDGHSGIYLLKIDYGYHFEMRKVVKK